MEIWDAYLPDGTLAGCDLVRDETVSYKWISETDFVAFVNSDSMIDVPFRRYEPCLKQMGYIQ